MYYSWVKWYRYQSIEAPRGIGFELRKYRSSNRWLDGSFLTLFLDTGAKLVTSTEHDSSIVRYRPSSIMYTHTHTHSQLLTHARLQAHMQTCLSGVIDRSVCNVDTRPVTVSVLRWLWSQYYHASGMKHLYNLKPCLFNLHLLCNRLCLCKV